MAIKRRRLGLLINSRQLGWSNNFNLSSREGILNFFLDQEKQSFRLNPRA